jgi:dihydrofolate reductase
MTRTLPACPAWFERWTVGRERAHSTGVESTSHASAHPMGATTYAGWATYRPTATGPFARPLNEMPKVVFSNWLTSADWGETTIAAGDLSEAIARLEQERSDGYLLAHGGTRFTRSLAETGLIDEYRLVIHPAVLGGGERIFSARSSSRGSASPLSAAEPSLTS